MTNFGVLIRETSAPFSNQLFIFCGYVFLSVCPSKSRNGQSNLLASCLTIVINYRCFPCTWSTAYCNYFCIRHSRIFIVYLEQVTKLAHAWGHFPDELILIIACTQLGRARIISIWIHSNWRFGHQNNLAGIHKAFCGLRSISKVYVSLT